MVKGMTLKKIDHKKLKKLKILNNNFLVQKKKITKSVPCTLPNIEIVVKE